MSSSNGQTLALEIGTEESFTRFIFSRNHFAPDKGRVKPQAMLPILNEETHRWETSTHRIENLNPPAIWEMGYQHVENASAGRLIKARGTGLFSLATSQGLGLDVNGPPAPRHVDIIGWSSSDKGARLMAATEIANKLHLELDSRGTAGLHSRGTRD